MVTKTLFRKIARINDELEFQINAAYDADDHMIRISEKALLHIDAAIRKVKELVSPHVFDSIAEEVYFFKKLKPQISYKFIYYSTILELESHKPDAGNKIVRKYYEEEQEKLKTFYSKNSEFYSYYTRDATYLDHKYFVRNSYDLKMKLSSEYYNLDASFTTAKDHLLAKFIAYGHYEDYLKKQIDKLSDISSRSLSPLVWSGSKVGLIELVYALYHMRCFNGGNIELSEVVKFVEKSLETDLGNFHKTVFEIKTRKQGPTKFLKLVDDNLQQHFAHQDSDGL
ncbi:RteC domain-containing protein [uncultured Chryseobacterium sp.]|uniref:RteC domain-containing protein n=1 Tax=uncultured Chryseobacterium sp. TaxID=259322 RepID=UPI002585E040|nr:RteC domain-containing protein [uncultured Chryseobacterium sp.]